MEEKYESHQVGIHQMIKKDIYNASLALVPSEANKANMLAVWNSWFMKGDELQTKGKEKNWKPL